MLKIRFKLGRNGIIEEIVDHKHDETVTTEERLQVLHVARKRFLKSQSDSSFISKYSRLYPLDQRRGMFLSSCISHQ